MSWNKALIAFSTVAAAGLTLAVATGSSYGQNAGQNAAKSGSAKAAVGQASKSAPAPSPSQPASGTAASAGAPPGAAAGTTPTAQADTRPADVRHGEYLVKAAGCVGCHTVEGKGVAPFSGGRALKTDFGTFYGPNITPDKTAGIGAWTEDDFKRALREGVGRDGTHLYPAFPYPSFTKIADADVHDLWAYLQTVPASAQANKPHELKFPFSWRFLLVFWKWLFFTPGPDAAMASASAEVSRGAYLVNALAHCGECHTERNFFGAVKKDRQLAGTPGKDGAPNITPAKLKWSDGELKDFFSSGMTPDNDQVNDTMGEVITNTTSQLTAQDTAALIAYLKQVPAIESKK